MTSIGFLSYMKSHLDPLTTQRLRALLAEAALQGAAIALLDGNGCDIPHARIPTARWDGIDWQTGQAELPDVVILREPPRTPAQQAADAWIRRSRPVIADVPIDKLDLHALLASGPLAAHAIPTQEIPSGDAAATLSSFLDRHGSAVVKAADGQRGIGIRFVAREGDGWSVRKDGDRLDGSLQEAVRHVTAAIQGRLGYRRYLVQKFIPTVARDGRPMDIRVHVQRRADRNWAITRAYVRLAEVGMPLTNISRGGYQGPLEGALEGRGRPMETLRDEVLSLALDVCTAVDATRPLPLSELGVDLAIDGEGHLWILEANVFPQSSLHEHDWAIHTIGYAKAVAAGVRP